MLCTTVTNSMLRRLSQLQLALVQGNTGVDYRPVVASIRAQVRGTGDTMLLVFKYLLSGLEW